jgi:hypothetical protein
MASAWAAIANPCFVGLATGTPGSTATVANEASGGTPAYARVSCALTDGTGGVVTGAATSVNGFAATFTFAIVCTAITGNNMFDNVAIATTTLTGNAPIIVTPGMQVT